ncbi:EAL domain-containing protein [Undibacterium baiyunense]|uniref:EAL domain-containing protein n=1 Tax=Undibacterium baiyunense TaxID=2828731 RepID=A0A941DBJ7_9BURK|nr:EAL domain-containing protein [Undibacterium baiyunense]MBR7745664.1 EAL domain-containing protein [Undibacterium baiyunense]
MLGLTRRRYILLATCIYAVFACAWIFLSDQLLTMLTDVSSMLWLSTVKGIFFVVATTTLFYFAMHAVPVGRDRRAFTLSNNLADEHHSLRQSPWLVYGLTLALTAGMFVLHQTVALGVHGEPMLILFIFPIVLSAMLGGLWSGLLSTTLAATGIYLYVLDPRGSFAVKDSTDLFQWLIFVVNGLAVSILSELLQHAMAKDEKHRRLLDAIVSGTSDAVYVKNLQGRYVMANQAMANHLEIPIEDILGAHDSELFDVSSTEFITGNDRRMLASGNQQEHEAHLTTKAGKKLVFLATKGPLIDQQGKIFGVFGISHEISELKRIEQDLQLVLQEAGDAIWITNARGEFIFANPSACKVTGHSLSQLQMMSIPDLLDDMTKLKLEAHLRELAVEKFIRRDWPLLRSDGSLVQVEMITKRLPDGRYVAFGRDLSEVQLAQKALVEREKQLARVLEGTDQGYWDWNLKTNQFEVSARWETMLGYAPGEMQISPEKSSLYMHPLDYPKALKSLQDHLAGKSSLHELELRMLTKTGEWRWILTRGRVVEWDEAGTPVRMSGTHTDIAEKKVLEQAQRDAATVFSSSYEGIMMVDIHGLISKVNPAFTRITGYFDQEVLGKSPKILASGRHPAEFYQHLWRDLIKNDFWRGEVWNRRKSGEEYIELLSISAVRDELGTVLHYIGVFSDITQLKAHEDELDKIAHYDTLTGLPNRRLLSDRLGQALIRAQRDQSLLAVCFLDLDGFKLVNDRHGHHIGDQLLIGVTAHLRNVLRANDTLARIGGDEFVILLSDIKNSMECMQVLDRVLLAASHSVRVDDIVLQVTASVGVSLFPDDNADADSLMRHADQAMYVAKNAGKNRYHLFDPESDRKAQLHRSFLELLNTALINREFVLYYQPKVDLRDGRVVGAEALIRWKHPERGILSPAEFLSYIHGSALDQKLGEWVIQEALTQGEIWHQQGLAISISVNISADHLLHRDFSTHLAFALSQHSAMPAHCFELEVLETAAIVDIEQAVDILQSCRRLGVRFSLDDFGTGYSSLTYLRKLPIDTLKIDQSFVRDMLHDAEDLGIVEGVIRLANAFHREVIAEGVETLAHGAALLNLGCHLAQGYGVARPMPAEQLKAWSEQWQAEQAWLPLLPDLLKAS